MKAKALKLVNNILKIVPDSLLENVENYIDFLSFKYAQDSIEIPQSHKEEVFRRIKLNHKPSNAFDMIDDLDQ